MKSRLFFRGACTDEPICMIDVADSNAIYYYHRDALGSERTKGTPQNIRTPFIIPTKLSSIIVTILLFISSTLSPIMLWTNYTILEYDNGWIDLWLWDSILWKAELCT